MPIFISGGNKAGPCDINNIVSIVHRLEINCIVIICIHIGENYLIS